jgi:hypothetical protein
MPRTGLFDRSQYLRTDLDCWCWSLIRWLNCSASYCTLLSVAPPERPRGASDLSPTTMRQLDPFSSSWTRALWASGPADQPLPHSLDIPVRDVHHLEDVLPFSFFRPFRDQLTGMRKGSKYLQATLIECAWAASRTKGTCFRAQFRRIARDRRTFDRPKIDCRELPGGPRKRQTPVCWSS